MSLVTWLLQDKPSLKSFPLKLVPLGHSEIGSGSGKCLCSAVGIAAKMPITILSYNTQEMWVLQCWTCRASAALNLILSTAAFLAWTAAAWFPEGRAGSCFTTFRGQNLTSVLRGLCQLSQRGVPLFLLQL